MVRAEAYIWYIIKSNLRPGHFLFQHNNFFYTIFEYSLLPTTGILSVIVSLLFLRMLIALLNSLHVESKIYHCNFQSFVPILLLGLDNQVNTLFPLQLFKYEKIAITWSLLLGKHHHFFSNSFHILWFLGLHHPGCCLIFPCYLSSMLLRKGHRILETGSDQLELIGLFLTDWRILALTSFRLYLKHVTWLFHTEITVNIKKFFLFFSWVHIWLFTFQIVS